MTNQSTNNSATQVYVSQRKQELADQVQELRESWRVRIITPIEQVERSLNSSDQAVFYTEVDSPYLQSVSQDLTLTIIKGEANDN